MKELKAKFLLWGAILVLVSYSSRVLAQSSGRALYLVYSIAAPEGYKAILDFSPGRALFQGEKYTGQTRTKIDKKEFTKEGRNIFININLVTPADEVCVEMDARRASLESYEWLMRGGNLYEYITHEPLREIAWELVDSTKQFGRFEARGAKCAFRGREYEVWYVPEIPVSFGPWKFNGLPGLIVEASETNGGAFRFVLQEVEIKAGHKVPEAKYPRKAKRIPIATYAYFHDNKAADESDLARARAPRGETVTTQTDADGGDEMDVERNFKDLVTTDGKE